MATALSRPSIGRLKAPKPTAVVEADLGGRLHGFFVRQPALPMVEVRLALPLAAAQVSKPAPVRVLVESLLAGTGVHDRLGLAQAVGDLGGRLDAHADDDRLVLSGSVLAANLEPFLRLMAEVVVSATYPGPEVLADRERVADETVIVVSQPAVIARQALRRRLFGAHPYATPIPSPAALRRVKASELALLHTVLFDEGPAQLVVVGDVRPERVTGLARDVLGPWLDRRTAGERGLAPVSPPRPGPLELVERPGSVQSNLRLGGMLPSLVAPDWPATSLAVAILGGMFSSRLMANLRERHGYGYSPGFAVRHFRAAAYGALVADVATPVTAAALVEVRYELGRLASTGVTDDELELARHHAVGRFSIDTSTQAGLASVLASLVMNGAGPGYMDRYPRAVIAMTKQEVEEAAQKYLAPARFVTLVVGDPQLQAALALLDDVVVRPSP